MLREPYIPVLYNSLSQFLEKLAETLDIPESYYRQAEKRLDGTVFESEKNP